MLWDRIQQLFIDSNSKLAKTWIVKYIAAINDSVVRFNNPLAIGGDPMTIILEQDLDHTRENNLLTFAPEEYKRFWPDTQPQAKVWAGRGETWEASKEMLDKLHTQMQKAFTRHVYGVNL